MNRKFSSRQVNCREAIRFCPYPPKNEFCTDMQNKTQHKAFLSFRNRILFSFLVKEFRKLLLKLFVCVKTTTGWSMTMGTKTTSCCGVSSVLNFFFSSGWELDLPLPAGWHNKYWRGGNGTYSGSSACRDHVYYKEERKQGVTADLFASNRDGSNRRKSGIYPVLTNAIHFNLLYLCYFFSGSCCFRSSLYLPYLRHCSRAVSSEAKCCEEADRFTGARGS